MFDFTFFSLNRSRKSFRFDTIYKPFLKSYIYKHIEHWPTWKSHHLVKATKALEKYSKTLAFSRKFFFFGLNDETKLQRRDGDSVGECHLPSLEATVGHSGSFVPSKKKYQKYYDKKVFEARA